ncbi:MAG: hypothetical protein QM817_10335 [Archangium sp.]
MVLSTTEEALAFVARLMDLAKEKGVAGLEVQIGAVKVEFGFKSEKPEEKPSGNAS